MYAQPITYTWVYVDTSMYVYSAHEYTQTCIHIHEMYVRANMHTYTHTYNAYTTCTHTYNAHFNTFSHLSVCWTHETDLT